MEVGGEIFKNLQLEAPLLFCALEYVALAFRWVHPVTLEVSQQSHMQCIRIPQEFLE